eukprot:scaffold166094_cov46-Attheya_sp.AAC.1
MRTVRDEESVWSIVVKEVTSPVRSHEEGQKSKPLKFTEQFQLQYANHEVNQVQQESESFFAIGSNFETFLIPMDVNEDETITVQNERNFLVSLLRTTKDQQQQRIVVRQFVHLSGSAKSNPNTVLQLYGTMSVEIEIAKEYISCNTDTNRKVFQLGWVRVSFLVLGSLSAIGLLAFAFFTWLESRIEEDEELEEEEEYDTIPVQYTWQALGTSTNATTTYPLPNNDPPTRREVTHVSTRGETNQNIAPSETPRPQIPLQQENQIEHSRSHIEEMNGGHRDSPLISNLHANHEYTNTNHHIVNSSFQILDSENEDVRRSQLDRLNQEPQSTIHCNKMDNTEEVIVSQASKHELHSGDEVDSVAQPTDFDNCRNDAHPFESQGLPDETIIFSRETIAEQSSKSNVNIDSQEILKSQWRLEKEDAPEERAYRYTEDGVESATKASPIGKRDGQNEVLLQPEESGKLVEKVSGEEDSASIIFPPTCSQPCFSEEDHSEYDASTTSFHSKEEVDAKEPAQSPNATMEEKVNLWQDSPASIGGNTNSSCRVDNMVVDANDGDGGEAEENTRLREEHYNTDQQGNVLERKQQGKMRVLHDSNRHETANLEENESSEDRLTCLEKLNQMTLPSSQADSGSKQIAQILPPVLKRKTLAYLFDANNDVAENPSKTFAAQDEILFTDTNKNDSLKEKEITSEESSSSRAGIKQANNARAKKAKITVPAPIVPDIVPSAALVCISKEIQSSVWEFGEGVEQSHTSRVTGVKQQVQTSSQKSSGKKSCHKSKSSSTSNSPSLHSKKAPLGKVDTPKNATGFTPLVRKRTIPWHPPIESDTKRPRRRKS